MKALDLIAERAKPCRFDDPSALPLPTLRRLRWAFDESVFHRSADVVAGVLKEADALSLRHLKFDAFGKAHLKAMRISPDSFVQMAFQLADFRARGRTVSTYESASTRSFRRGRTEAIRCASAESAEFVRAFLNPATDYSTRSNLLRAAIVRHKQCVLDSRGGHGVDRHLLALRTLAAEGNFPTAREFFSSRSYAALTASVISTSHLSSSSATQLAFGPVHADGLGVGYGISEGGVGFAVSDVGGSVSAEAFVHSLASALTDMERSLEKARE